MSALELDSFVLPTETLTRGNPDRALDAAPYRIGGRLVVGGQEHFYLEGQIAMVLPQEDGGLLVYSSTQHPDEVQHLVARATGRFAKDVICICRRMGGAFGGKETQAATVACIAALMTVKSGRSCKLRLDRDVDMVMTGKRHDFVIDYDAGFDATGRILGIEFVFASRCGISADLSGPVNDRAMFHCDNAYFLENLRIVSHRCRTNTVSNIVDVLFEPTPNGTPDWLRYLAVLRRRDVSAVLCTYLGGGPQKFVVTDLGVYHFPAVATDRVLDQAKQNLRTYRVAQRHDGWFLELVGGRGFNVAVFGAGHVGSAVVRTLCALECDIRWIDTRRNIFRKTPRNVRAIECERPAAEVDAMPADSCYLVMTHDHDLDFDICARILGRNDAAYCGLIGSQSKRRRFEKKYVQQGLSQMAIDQLVCSIGIDGIRGKKPAEIAISASAQVLRAHEELRRTIHVEGPVERHQSDDAQ